MTEKQLALELMRAGRLSLEQVQAAARLRSPGKSFAHILLELGWVSSADILKHDPAAFNFPPLGSAKSGAPLHQAPISEIPVQIPFEVPIFEAAPEAASLAAQNGKTPVGLGGQKPTALANQSVVLEGGAQTPDDPTTGMTVRVCNEILIKAVEMGASDVHLEPRQGGMLPRFRVDGHLRPGQILPREIQAGMVSRMKVMANLNITETRLSQDGRFRATVGGRRLDFRVSTLPGILGEKVVLRLLDHTSLVTDLKQLGFTGEVKTQFEEMLRRAHGMILVTGPTGSGKSTTLYAALASTLDESKNVVTVEDPVEYELEGVMQCHVHNEIGNTFARRLRSILRQDPDVILVGEIRDTETADISVRAALTGHLVLSTLHTNSAAASIARLEDMGVQPFLIASSLSGVIAQRLVRLICPHCREPLPPDSPEYELAVVELKIKRGTELFRGAGCPECHGTGHRGRVAIMELLNVDKDIRRAIMNRAHSEELHSIAITRGMRTLYQDGLDKLQQGLTTAAELARVMLGNEELEMF